MKYVFYLSIIATLAFVCIGLVNSRQGIVAVGAAAEAKKPLQLTIEFGQRREPVSGSLEFSGHQTVFDLLQAVAAVNRVKVDYSGSGETVFIKAIDGVVGGEGDNPWWVYLVNNQLANEGCGTKRLESGDRVTWRLGKYPE